MAKIVKCRVESILGAQSVEFSPNGESVTIGGENGSGKSSTLWALVMALAGRREIPSSPVTSGQEAGTVEIELDRFKVFFEVAPDRSSKLRIESADGARYSSPQSMLNKVFGSLSFDPGVFKGLDQKGRVDLLKDLIGIDTSKLDAEREAVYAERRALGKQIAMQEAKVAGRQIESSLSIVPLPISSLISKLEAAKDQAAMMEGAKEQIEADKGEIEQINIKIEEKEREILDLKSKRLRLSEKIEQAEEALNDLTPPDLAGIRQQLAEAESENARIQENEALKSEINYLGELRLKQKGLTKKISEIDQEKAQRLSGVKYPIEGLSFSEEGVFYNSIPFEQLSESEQWIVSLSVGFALNPGGILFMRQGGGLDKKTRAAVRERAKGLGVQLFLEVVDDAEDVQILIEAGQVKENRLKAAAQEVKPQGIESAESVSDV